MGVKRMSTDRTDRSPDLGLLVDSARKCRQENGTLKTDHYLCVIHELKKLMTTLYPGLARALHHVSRSLRSLEIHRVSGVRSYYTCLYTLVQYEAACGMLKGTSKLISGGVALYNLNQALGFGLEFLSSLQEREKEKRSFPAVERINTYKDTVGQHQSVLTQTSCKLMLARCPGRQRLMRKLIGCCHGEKDPTVVLGDIVDSLRLIHTLVDRTLMSMPEVN